MSFWKSKPVQTPAPRQLMSAEDLLRFGELSARVQVGVAGFNAKATVIAWAIVEGLDDELPLLEWHAGELEATVTEWAALGDRFNMVDAADAANDLAGVKDLLAQLHNLRAQFAQAAQRFGTPSV